MVTTQPQAAVGLPTAPLLPEGKARCLPLSHLGAHERKLGECRGRRAEGPVGAAAVSLPSQADIRLNVASAPPAAAVSPHCPLPEGAETSCFLTRVAAGEGGGVGWLATPHPEGKGQASSRARSADGRGEKLCESRPNMGKFPTSWRLAGTWHVWVNFQELQTLRAASAGRAGPSPRKAEPTRHSPHSVARPPLDNAHVNHSHYV